MQLNEQRHNQIAEDFHGDERHANQRENVQPDAAMALTTEEVDETSKTIASRFSAYMKKIVAAI